MKITVHDIIQSLMAPVGRLEQTVDTLLSGDPQAEVTGIVTAFMPTQKVLKEAVARGVNLVIAHEGTFFSHHSSFESALKDDPVYQAKKKFIEESGLAIFRFHDYIHRYQPDGITEGLAEVLSWKASVVKRLPASSIVELPADTTVKELVRHVKSKLAIDYVRAAGNMELSCKRVGILVGYRGGGQLAIPLFAQEDLDVIICGEGPEWETPEYVRDAVWQGRAKALIMIGHAASEEAGMMFLAERLRQQFPNVPVHYLADKPVLQIL
jgi:putative NIF3 family GTP cyclohydrolase 1 type 2